MRHALTVIKYSFWLGWENESNWTKRPFYFIYAAIRPLAACVLLYFLFRVASPDPAANATFISVYLSNAFFTIFVAVSGGIAWVIIEDREFFRLIRYIVIAPMSFILYVMGRTMLVLVISLVSLTIILFFGALILKIPFSPASIHWPLLLSSLALGIWATGALGLITAGVVLVTARHSTLLAEGIGGIFLLMCGVIYPIDFLPKAAQKVSLVLPFTYWMEVTRRAFERPAFGTIMTEWSTPMLVGALTISCLVLSALAFALFTFFYRWSIRTGKIDQTTHY